MSVHQRLNYDRSRSPHRMGVYVSRSPVRTVMHATAPVVREGAVVREISRSPSRIVVEEKPVVETVLVKNVVTEEAMARAEALKHEANEMRARLAEYENFKDEYHALQLRFERQA